MNTIGKLLLSGMLGLSLSTVVLADAQPAGDDREPIELSDAEILLWMKEHLDNINEPVELRYDFARTGSHGDGFEDTVTLEIIKLHDDGSKSANMEFFTGPRKQPVGRPNLTNVYGNPVIGIFMQGDVMEMNRLTDGSWRYFQQRIKHALADTAQVENVTFDFDGDEVSGTKVSIAPYVDDERRAHFDRYADKVYEFTFSEDVPGMLYQIRTVVPDNVNLGAEPLIEEVLTFSRVGELSAETLSRLE